MEFDGRNENDEKLTFEPKTVRLSLNPGSTLSKNNKSPFCGKGGLTSQSQLCLGLKKTF